jgi:hypothetical protein
MSYKNIDYATTYAAMGDEELLAIAECSTALTDTAGAALHEELSKRHLTLGLTEENALEARRIDRNNQQPWQLWLASRLNTSRMTVLLPPWAGNPAEEALRILLREQIIGGWVAVLASQMILGGLMSLVILGKAWLSPHPTVFSDWLCSVWVPIAIPLDLLFLFAGVGLWKRWRSSLRIANIALVGSVIYSIIFPALVVITAFANKPPPASVLTPSPEYSFLPALLPLLARLAILLSLGVLNNLMWLLYLRRSRRVRLTYPNG